MDAILEEAADQSREDVTPLSAIELGERVRELLEVLSSPAPTLALGTLREVVRGFDGTDQMADFAGKKLRLVASDSTRRQFISVLQHLLQETTPTLLLRSAAALVSGQVTTELMTQFKARHFFHSITTSEAALLAGLGSVLASLGEGNYDSLLTEPPATKEHVLAVLRDSGRLRSLRVWQAVQEALAGKPVPEFPPAPVLAAGPPVVVPLPVPKPMDLPAPAPVDMPLQVPPLPAMAPSALVLSAIAKSRPAPLSKNTQETVEVLLKTERWMEVRRLHRRLEELGCVCSLESLRYALRIAPLAEFAMLHPLDPTDAGEGPQIVLWHESVH